MSPSQSAIGQRGWGFQTVRSGIDPGDLRFFRHRFVEAVEIWKALRSGDGKLYSPGAAGPRRLPVGQLSPRAGTMRLSQSATSP